MCLSVLSSDKKPAELELNTLYKEDSGRLYSREHTLQSQRLTVFNQCTFSSLAMGQELLESNLQFTCKDLRL